MIKPILAWPNSRLRRGAERITSFDDEVVSIFNDLVDTMLYHRGVGLAATQMGVVKDIFVIHGQIFNAHHKAFINTSIISSDDEMVRSKEGCLSFPGIFLWVPRPKKLIIEFQSLSGELSREGLVDLPARCVAHEYDHLHGKLMIDFVSERKKNAVMRRLRRARK